MVTKDGGRHTVREPSKGPSTNNFGFKEDKVEWQKATLASSIFIPHTQFVLDLQTRKADRSAFSTRFSTLVIQN